MKWYLKCFKQYSDFKGRASRKEFWMFTLFNAIIAVVLSVLLVPTLKGVGASFIYIYGFAVLLPSLAVSVRRLHDIGKSGKNVLFGLIPLVGQIMLIVWFCTDGEQGSNKWGKEPKKEPANIKYKF